MEYSGLVIQSITPVLVALIGLSWYSQEKTRRKMERYEKLIEYLFAFYESYNLADASEDEKEKKKQEVYLNKKEFIQQYRLAFMYCPDEVIKKINSFFDCVHTHTRIHSDTERYKSVGELIIAIRNDIYNRSLLKIPVIKISYYKKSKLSSEDFKHVAPT